MISGPESSKACNKIFASVLGYDERDKIIASTFAASKRTPQCYSRYWTILVPLSGERYKNSVF